VLPVFQRLDKNGDGKVSKAEAGGAPWFARVDANSDSVLDAAELARLRSGATRPPGTPTTPTTTPPPGTTRPMQAGGQVGAMIQQLDKNADGKITKEDTSK
jgi:Ca2+-binding EF-hand superfamily protein